MSTKKLAKNKLPIILGLKKGAGNMVRMSDYPVAIQRVESNPSLTAF